MVQNYTTDIYNSTIFLIYKAEDLGNKFQSLLAKELAHYPIHYFLKTSSGNMTTPNIKSLVA